MRTVPFFFILISFGCTNKQIPEVPTVEVEAGAQIQTVSYPPPAALPEVVPKQPSESAVWLDGYWVFKTDHWLWIRGGWIDGSSGLQLVRSRFWYDESGALKFSDRRFQSRDGRAMAPPEILLAAGTPPTPLLSEEATVP